MKRHGFPKYYPKKHAHAPKLCPKCEIISNPLSKDKCCGIDGVV